MMGLDKAKAVRVEVLGTSPTEPSGGCEGGVGSGPDATDAATSTESHVFRHLGVLE